MTKETESSTGSVVGAVATGVAMAVCCGAGILASVGGLGIIASFLVSPWALVPAFAVLAGIVYWRRQRARACRPNIGRRSTASSARR